MTEREYLYLIDVLAKLIRHLTDKLKWHTGTPTEEGWYLVQHLSDAEYCGSKFFVARWDGEKFIINPRPPIVVTYPNGTAWQKITPYVEASKEK